MPHPLTHNRKHTHRARAGNDMWDARVPTPDEEPLSGSPSDSSPGGWHHSSPRHSRGFARFASALVAVGAFLMFVVIAWALSSSTDAGNNTEQLNWLLANPWGIVSLVDLYVGFSVYSLWIWFREPNRVVALAWTVVMMTTGWLGGCLYALNCLRRFDGDWAWFFMGPRRR